MYKILNKNTIKIINNDEFNIAHILECGQIFRYDKISNSIYRIISGKHNAYITEFDDYSLIESDNIDYFINYFDLNTNYTKIKEKLISSVNTDFVKKAIDYGYGIRILKQDILEVFIGFILSGNNNIKRISGSMNYISKLAGDCIFDIKNKKAYTFPSLSSLKKLSENDFKNAGAGYRSRYLYEFVQMIDNQLLNDFKNLETHDIYKKLIEFKGIGPKIADCILLFGYNKMDVFPVDTWIKKFYATNFKKNANLGIRDDLIRMFGSLSGYTQQYIFYYIRNSSKFSSNLK